MFALGVVFFEMWYPFSSNEERTQVLTDLVKNQIIPQKWSEIFPIQAKIISLLLQPANKRPSAIDLLQAKLVPSIEIRKDGTDLKNITNAISSGTITLDSHAPEVLSALFADSRKMPFRLNDFDGINPKDQLTSKFHTYAITQFYNLAVCFGGYYFTNSLFQSINSDEFGVIVMSNDGSLHCLSSSATRPFHYWIQKNGIKSLRTYSKRNIFHENRKYGSILEDEILSYDITTPYDIHCVNDDYIEALDFTFSYLFSIFPNITEKLSISICHGGILKELAQPKNSSLINRISSLKFEKLSELNQELEDNSLLKDSLSEVAMILGYVRHFSQKLSWKISVKQPKRQIGNSFMVKIRYGKSKAGFDLAYIGGINTHSRATKMETIEKSPIITSVHIPLKSLTYCYTLNKGTIKSKQIEILIIITCTSFTNQKNQSPEQFERTKYSPNEWNRSFTLLQKVA